MKLPIEATPVSQKQIVAANLFHDRMELWRTANSALHRLRDNVPGWDAEASLLKCIAVNALYGTQVFAIARMAQHVKGHSPNE